MPTSEAIRAGLRGIEHLTSFGTALADPQRAAEFKEAVSAHPNARSELRHRLWAQLDLESDKTRQVIQLIVEREVFVSPTLAVFERHCGDDGSTAMEAEVAHVMLNGRWIVSLRPNPKRYH